MSGKNISVAKWKKVIQGKCSQMFTLPVLMCLIDSLSVFSLPDRGRNNRRKCWFLNFLWHFRREIDILTLCVVHCQNKKYVKRGTWIKFSESPELHPELLVHCYFKRLGRSSALCCRHWENWGTVCHEVAKSCRELFPYRTIFLLSIL